MTEQYLDSRGVAFGDYRLLLPGRVADWPLPIRIRVEGFGFKCRWRWSRIGCFVCGACDPDVIMDVHHLFAGRHGRSDELCAACLLCRACHERYGPQSDENVGLLLGRKWVVDRATTDWVRSALLRRRHLPDLIFKATV